MVMRSTGSRGMEMRLLLVADVLGTLPFSPAYQSILLIMILSTNPNDLYISRFTVIVIAVFKK